MDTEALRPAETPADSVNYQQDERWLLVQRVLASPGFQRAAQLRHMLEYITRAALLNPNSNLREYEIACEVLGRRANFDPTIDNIVRSQMSQLRRRLDVYFTEQAPQEPMRIVIAKGSYLPQFQRVPQAPPKEDLQVQATSEIPPQPVLPPPVLPPHSRRNAGLTTFAVIALTGLALWGWLSYRQRGSAAGSANTSGSFVQFLKLKGPDVTIVLPDASLMLVQRQLGDGITSEQYSIGSALKDQIARHPNPDMRQFLEAIRERRLINVNEAMSAEDLKDTLARNGVNATLKFARDMHTRDFGEGNLILIGSRRSNPWTELFAPHTNFRFLQDNVSRQFVYRNMAPAAGEAAAYQPYEEHEGKLSSYADVAFTANLTHSGYVLLINGSDYAANEAAISYLLHGRLREDLSSLLRRDDLTYFEVLLRGSHADNDAEESFDLVALRPAGIAR